MGLSNGKRVLELDQYEHSLLIHSLNEQRNQMIEEHEPTDAVDEILLKVIDAPITKERRGWWRDEER
ncbi:MAG TPA: hypothetical protein H9765_01595 [Candidatus Mediterraneibacter intestinigallinarum]|nr:hypothetical protein [Candidatus Mediterraneibacter intestinigallinarum]